MDRKEDDTQDPNGWRRRLTEADVARIQQQLKHWSAHPPRLRTEE